MEKESIIKNIAKELFNKMGFIEVKVDIEKQEQSPILMVNIKIPESEIKSLREQLNLNAIQKILRLMVKKRLAETSLFLIDINDYRKKRESFLKKLSKELADEVAKTRKSIMLQPMSSYERRIIHLELAERPDITTESIGEEPERRVVIRPYP